MGSSRFGFDDSLSVTAAREESGSGYREGCSRTGPEAVTETLENDSSLNGNHRREQLV